MDVFFICHICHSEDKPENKCLFLNLSPTASALVPCVCHLLPEEDVPEEQPARVDQQGDEWVNQRAVEIMVQDPLGDD